MSPATHSIEQSRLEIILLAAGVLVLVLFFGVFILVCVSLTHTNAPLSRNRATPWGGYWNERWDAGPLARGQDEGFFDNVRRRSVSIAEEVRKKLTILKQFLTLDMPDYGDVPRQRYIESTDSMLYNTTTLNDETDHGLSTHMLDDVSNWHDLLESPASSTGRDRKGGCVTKRPERAIVHGDSCDLEAQDSDDSEH
ncbi:hypothetical protein MAC_07168 [Metarhizium acridum CQMa 102]|uniref:Uncharacterized protein n=1 Tax=Metarhizium acridum (strain CQMa 102) TaxID=655827 RepID=E9EBC0_METAQ|nr:uncharacterized protein MAC_07168 [Metarhizium acridum CQMa 102]EFY86764.1 hypothetical protein MAC_07168 [Metarhizium acridum CQMa 102]